MEPAVIIDVIDAIRAGKTITGIDGFEYQVDQTAAEQISGDRIPVLNEDGSREYIHKDKVAVVKDDTGTTGRRHRADQEVTDASAGDKGREW